ncbi:MAG: FtsW/RodA/SpoVE family cell cycle protein [Lachnospiraceae bacterium]|nr:FtsW/RodA/SpoVE family cell cycle protein [Lachnospiraceae bacterium]
MSDTTRRQKASLDLPLILSCMALMTLGIIMIYSTTSRIPVEEGHLSNVQIQLLAEFIGVVGVVIIYALPYKLFRWLGKKPARYVILVIAFVSLLLLFTPLAHSAKGATRWISVGPLHIQPAEFIKIAIIFFAAGFLSDHPNTINTKFGFGWSFGMVALFAGLVYGISNNLSSAIIIAAIGVAMIMAASNKWILQLLVYSIGVVLIVIYAMGKAHAAQAKGPEAVENLKFRYKRILIWENPSDPQFLQVGGYQTMQALYAIGSGGPQGKGIGKSVQKLDVIPEVHNDMIYSVLCEELGLFGVVAIFFLFGVLLFRCLAIGLGAKDSYGTLICLGVMVHIGLQVILNVMVVTNTMPNTGVSLPFISYGGSSAVFILAEVGLVLRVARENAA